MCSHEPLRVAEFWAAVLGSEVDEDSTPDRAWVEPAGWGGPSLWFVRVPEDKVAKTRQHVDLRPAADPRAEVERLVGLRARVLRDDDELVVMVDPEGVLRRVGSDGQGLTRWAAPPGLGSMENTSHHRSGKAARRGHP